MLNHLLRKKKIVMILCSAEERDQVVQVLEREGFPVRESIRRFTDFGRIDWSTMILQGGKNCSMGVEPFIGAAMVTGGQRFYSVREFLSMAADGFSGLPLYPVFHVPEEDRPLRGLVPSLHRMGHMFFPFALRAPEEPLSCLSDEACLSHAAYLFSAHPALLWLDLRRMPEEALGEEAMEAPANKGANGACASPADGLREACGGSSAVFSAVSSGVSSAASSPASAPDVYLGADPRFTTPFLLPLAEEALDAAGLTHARSALLDGPFVPQAPLPEGNALLALRLAFPRRVLENKQAQPDGEALARLRDALEGVMIACAAQPGLTLRGLRKALRSQERHRVGGTRG